MGKLSLSFTQFYSRERKSIEIEWKMSELKLAEDAPAVKRQKLEKRQLGHFNELVELWGLFKNSM